MPKIELLTEDLKSVSRTYGTIYDTKIGKVSFTKLVSPEGYVLSAKDDQLRYYMYQPKGKTEYEHIWGASSIVKDGLPMSEGLLRWKLKQYERAGMLQITDPDRFSADILNDYADVGTHAHGAIEDILHGKEATIAGRNKKEQWCIISFANFFNDHQLRNWQPEQIVVHDRVINGLRVIYAGTTDLIVQIFNPLKDKWETWLIDNKTSAEAHLSHKLQVIAYKEAAEQCLGIKIDRIGILLLGKATVKGYQLTEIKKERKTVLSFDHFLVTYRQALLMNGGEWPAPKFKVFPISIRLKEDEAYGLDNSPNNTSDNSGGDTAGEKNPQGPKRGDTPVSPGGPRKQGHLEQAQNSSAPKRTAGSKANEPAPAEASDPAPAKTAERPASQPTGASGDLSRPAAHDQKGYSLPDKRRGNTSGPPSGEQGSDLQNGPSPQAAEPAEANRPNQAK